MFQRGICKSVIKLRLLTRSFDFSTPFGNNKMSLCTMDFSTVERGKPNTESYRMYYKNGKGTYVSPFHDIPLFSKESEPPVLNMVVEIPRWTNAKMEISKSEKLNPIKQDIKKLKLRFVRNVFPHHGYIWNYGALPQTWEDPQQKFEETNTYGDDDPLDVCEIGHKVHSRGALVQVKVLGTMLLVDEGETDWKIIVIDTSDPLAKVLNNIDDVLKEMPGLLKEMHKWFQYYKVPDGKPENTVHWGGQCKDRVFAMNVIDDAHRRWKCLISDPSLRAGGISCFNTTVCCSPDLVTAEKATAVVQSSAEPSSPGRIDDDEIDKWHYIVPHGDMSQLPA